MLHTAKDKQLANHMACALIRSASVTWTQTASISWILMSFLGFAPGMDTFHLDFFSCGLLSFLGSSLLLFECSLNLPEFTWIMTKMNRAPSMQATTHSSIYPLSALGFACPYWTQLAVARDEIGSRTLLIRYAARPAHTAKTGLVYWLHTAAEITCLRRFSANSIGQKR